MGEEPAEFAHRASQKPLEEVPIGKKLEAAIARRVEKGNVTMKEAEDNRANQVAKGVMKIEIEQYFQHLCLEVKDAKVNNFEALLEEIELVRIWIVSFRQI
ncbi:hypothetical protein NL676_034113 [Syzygium grande]|nr:hypothetical protein NL676_034113 [Syzygium grande]